MTVANPARPVKVVGGLPHWWAKLQGDAANAKIVLHGDSTSTEANDGPLYTRLRGIHMTQAGGLYGMTADTSHVIDGGNNGLSLATLLADFAGATGYNLNALFAAAPDLVVASWGINDLRTITDQTTAAMVAVLQPLLIQYVDTLRGRLPNCDIVLRVPNGATTDDLGAAHYIQGPPGTNNPAGGAQKFTTALRTAYLGLRDRWPNVVVWDAQEAVFGKLSIASTATSLWTNQIHPTAAGYAAIADRLVADVIGRKPVAPSKIPNTNTGGSSLGIISTTTTPWTVDPTAVEDTEHFQLVGEYTGTGTLATGSGTVPFGPVPGAGVVSRNDVLEILYQGGVEVIQSPTGATQTTPSSGGALPNYQVTLTVPSTLNGVTNYVVRVWRELDQGDALFSAVRKAGDGGVYQVVKVGRVQGGGSGILTIQAEPQDANIPASGTWPIMRSADKLYIAGGGANPISLSAATIQTSGAHLQITGLGAGVDGSTLVGRLVLLGLTHAGSTTNDKLRNQSIACGTVTAQSTKDITFTYTGARLRDSYTHLRGQPRNSVLPAGIIAEYITSADDQGTVRLANVTTADIVVGTLPFDFWLGR